MSMSDFSSRPDSGPLPRADGEPAAPAYYIPGRSKRKMLVVIYGLILCLLGLSQFWTPLRLLLSGTPVRGEVISVIKTKAGLPDLILTDDSQIQANLEPRDRSYVFWNEFSFHTAEGALIKVRAPVGSQLKPLSLLLDSDGLPSTDLIFYNPARPEEVVFPTLISTWFAPGMLFVSGLACMTIGAFLFYWSKKPIELPHIPSSGISPSGQGPRG